MSDIFKCGNCGHEDDYNNLPAARQLFQRLEVGDTYSNVECPKCGALCHPKEEHEASLEAVSFVNRVAGLSQDSEHGDDNTATLNALIEEAKKICKSL